MSGNVKGENLDQFLVIYYPKGGKNLGFSFLDMVLLDVKFFRAPLFHHYFFLLLAVNWLVTWNDRKFEVASGFIHVQCGILCSLIR